MDSNERNRRLIANALRELKASLLHHSPNIRRIMWLLVLLASSGPLAAGILGIIGFTGGGVAAGSIAALVHSLIGNVAAGSLFALLQSIAATGAVVGLGYSIGAGIAGITAIRIVRAQGLKGVWEGMKSVGEGIGQVATIAALGGMIAVNYGWQKLKRWWS